MVFKLLELFTQLFGWLQIAASPALTGIIIGATIYGIKRDKVGLVIAIITASLGVIAGIIWATKVWKKKGTVEFMSKMNATPELDNLEK
ncbi:MAG: hypothetical protein M3004_13800 [Bacteroidota bacterium]|nr:hypothetical protein [Bacteroidota bacterium]